LRRRLRIGGEEGFGGFAQNHRTGGLRFDQKEGHFLVESKATNSEILKKSAFCFDRSLLECHYCSAILPLIRFPLDLPARSPDSFTRNAPFACGAMLDR